MLVDAGLERNQCRVAERLALAGDRNKKAAGLHAREMTFFDSEVGHKLICLSDEPFVNFCAVEPRNRAALPVAYVVTLRRRTVADFCQRAERQYLPTLRHGA